MDYEKKYKEALEQAKFYHGNCPSEPERKKLEKIFPGLKESDDEKIRKEIIHYILYKANGVSEEQEHAWISYLEKRKEYVSDNFDDVWTTEDCTEIIEAGEKLSPRFKELLKKVCHAWYDKGIELVKRKEQNSNIKLLQKSWYTEGYYDREFNNEPKWIIKTGEGGPRYEKNPKYGQHIEEKPDTRDSDDLQLLGFIHDLLNEIEWKDDWAMSKEECLRLLSNYRPQKPAEKQDYSGLNDFERAIHRGFLCAGVENVPVNIIKETAQDCIAHLSAEWSEEDKRKLNRIYEILGYAADDKSFLTSKRIIGDKEAIELQDFLKSLRPQPKQEWSVEDKLMIKCCLKALEYYKYTGKRGQFMPA